LTLDRNSTRQSQKHIIFIKKKLKKFNNEILLDRDATLPQMLKLTKPVNAYQFNHPPRASHHNYGATLTASSAKIRHGIDNHQPCIDCLSSKNRRSLICTAAVSIGAAPEHD